MKRAGVEAMLAVLSGCLGLLTSVTRDWIEQFFRIDLDHHSGATEWLVVGVLMITSAVLAADAFRGWRRAKTSNA